MYSMATAYVIIGRRGGTCFFGLSRNTHGLDRLCAARTLVNVNPSRSSALGWQLSTWPPSARHKFSQQVSIVWGIIGKSFTCWGANLEAHPSSTMIWNHSSLCESVFFWSALGAHSAYCEEVCAAKLYLRLSTRLEKLPRLPLVERETLDCCLYRPDVELSCSWCPW